MEEHSQHQCIASVVSKSVFYTCCTVVVCMWFSSCRLDSTVIDTCMKSCKGYNSYMESVTTRECACGVLPSITSSKDDIWVLPKAKK